MAVCAASPHASMSMSVRRAAAGWAVVAAIACAPVSAVAGEGLFAKARVTIYPGDTILEGMVSDAHQPRGTDQMGQPLATREQAVGKVARRTLLRDQPILLIALRAPFAVLSGKMVSILYSDGDLTITGRGLAMQNGMAGDTIAVQNVDSNAIIRGRVRPDGAIEVGD